MTCAQCGRPGSRFRRSLCNACYQRQLRGGALATRPKLPATYVVSEWAWLSSFGLTRAEAAARLGMTKKALEKAIARHQKTQQQEAS